jgi:hypothetical protein
MTGMSGLEELEIRSPESIEVSTPFHSDSLSSFPSYVTKCTYCEFVSLQISSSGVYASNDDMHQQVGCAHSLFTGLAQQPCLRKLALKLELAYGGDWEVASGLLRLPMLQDLELYPYKRSSRLDNR